MWASVIIRRLLPRAACQENSLVPRLAIRTQAGTKWPSDRHRDSAMELTTWQRLRTRVCLFAVGVKRHMTLGTRVALIEGDRGYLIRQTYLPGGHFPRG